MSIQDIVNGGFEILGAPFIILSIIKLHKEKVVRGVNWLHVGFFSLWGFWNLYYYPHLGQWVSFWGGVFLTLANTGWLVQLIYYSNKEGGYAAPDIWKHKDIRR